MVTRFIDARDGTRIAVFEEGNPAGPAVVFDDYNDMAARIGIERRWYQGDHYDVTMDRRARAVEYGAREITWRHCSLMTVLRRRDPAAPLVSPEEGAAWLRARLAEKLGI